MQDTYWYCCVPHCSQREVINGYCRAHYWQKRRERARLEITTNDRQWYAERGRSLDEQALLARRMPLETASS